MQRTAKFGSYIIIPLKYDEQTFDTEKLAAALEKQSVTTMDLNENVKEIFNRSEHVVGSCYAVPQEKLCAGLDGAKDFEVRSEEGQYAFTIGRSYLYWFHTQVAFLCLQVTYDDMGAISRICNPGFAQNPARFYYGCGGQMRQFSMERWLDEFLTPLGLRKFFDGESSYLLDAYVYLLAVMPQRFAALEEMRQITFNLHQMVPVDSCVEDDSEADLRYVYAVKTPALGTYRWGCCVASQTISYVFADPEMDLEAEMHTQALDGLPVVLLAMYEKYTCIRFTQLITQKEKQTMKQIRSLKKTMLEFQAFGTVTPANLSRWHNVKQIYADLLEVSDVENAVEDVSSKIGILAEHQEELERSRSETLINLITLFGIISILASVLDIVELLSGGGKLIWVSMIVTNLALLLSMWLAMRTRK